MQRQNDGLLPTFPIWDDVRTFDGKPWRGIVDVVSGGFPCQDISSAGKGAGIDGERSGLWREMARIIGEVRPQFAFVENSPMLTVRGLGRVLGDLAEMGFDARWGVVSAASQGAPHKRERIWIAANAWGCEGKQRCRIDAQRGRADETEQAWVVGGAVTPDSESIGRRQGRMRRLAGDGARLRDEAQRNAADTLCNGLEGQQQDRTETRAVVGGCSWWAVEPDVGGTIDGLAQGVDESKPH